MATVLPAGHMQFNDDPEGDGVSVSAIKKKRRTEKLSPNFVCSKAQGADSLLSPKAIAFLSAGA